MESKPLVSIVTPCYNGEKFIDKYFESILNQTYTNLELIFVNDGSDDATEKIALSYKEKLINRGIKYKYIYQDNGGQARAVKNGLSYVRGELLIWPDSDDILARDSVEKRVNFLLNHPEYRLVRSNGHFFSFETGEYLRPISEDENRFNDDIFLDLILQKTYCFCGCYMIFTEDLRDVYPTFDIFISPQGQNWQLLIPIAGRFKCGYIDEDLYFIAERQGSHSRAGITAEEKASRYIGLNKILENTIGLACRNDRDYNLIIKEKLARQLMRLYCCEDDIDKGRKYYRQLKELNALNMTDRRIYLEHRFAFINKVTTFLRRIKN